MNLSVKKVNVLNLIFDIIQIYVIKISITFWISYKKVDKINMGELTSIMTVIRYVYVAIALGLVGNAFYNEYEKMATEDISRRQEYLNSEQRKYPSITFCHKFNHGSKQVIESYLPKFVESARDNSRYSEKIF